MTRQWLIPGGPYVNEDAARQYQIPGGPYFADTTASGSTYTLTASTGTFTETGNAAGLTFNRVLTAGTGTYTLTGNATGLYRNWTLTAGLGAFTETGNAANFVYNRVLTAGTGAFTLTGNAATLTYTPIGGPTYTLGAGTGSYALTGVAAGLNFNRVLSAGTGSYTLTGNAATLSRTYPAISRPVSDASAGAWTPSTGADLYAMIDEEVTDDADYISTTSASICRMKLGAVSSGPSPVLYWRSSSSTGSSVTTTLQEGTTDIASMTQVLTSTPTTYQLTLTAPQIASIGDWTNLYLKFESL